MTSCLESHRSTLGLSLQIILPEILKINILYHSELSSASNMPTGLNDKEIDHFPAKETQN